MSPRFAQVDAGGWPNGDTRPIAVLGVDPDELERRVGIRFSPQEDDLGALRLAVVALSRPATTVGLLCYDDGPERGTHVVGERSAPPGTLHAVLDALGLGPADVTWSAPAASFFAEESELTRLVEEHLPHMWATARAAGLDLAEAADVVQRVWTRFLAATPVTPPLDRWLTTMIREESLGVVRERRRATGATATDELAVRRTADRGPDPVPPEVVEAALALSRRSA